MIDPHLTSAEVSRKSPFIHKMNRTPPGVVCPPYYVLSHGNGCPYGCDYCCLQLPLRNVHRPIVFDGRERMLEEVRRFLQRGRAWLLSAGESSDSLALDHMTHLSRDLIPLFARQDEGMLFPKDEKHKLLFVTKSANVQGLLDVNERAHVVVSFSLNVPEVSARYEHGAPHPYARLKAAAQCQQAGYEVRIRIDPIIPLEEWRDMYASLIERIASEMDVEGLRFTLGTIRHNPGLRECARDRGRVWQVFNPANSREGADSRYRLPVALRRDVYGWFLEHLPRQASVALCKETKEVWDELGLDARNPGCNCAL
jgi:spore photoproduct lyase